MTYSPSAQREFARRLGESWKDLADHLGVRPDEVRRFPRGGVRSYRDPTENGRGTDVGHYPEGGTVHVVCQYSSGREIRDKPWGNRPLSTRAWYKLSTPDPQWIPSMYVRIVGPSAPALPECVP